MSGFPFHYSSLNHELAQSTPSGSINIMWNQLGEKMKADSIMFMTPNFDPTIGFTYPEFGIYGNNLLNPCLAINQTLQSFKDGSWMNNIGGGNWFNNMWNNNMWNNNWLNNMPWNNNNSNNSSVSDNPQYDALKALLTRYKELNPNDSKIKEINEALDKSGTAEEKMTALQEVYKKLSTTKSAKLQKALLDLPEYKDMLKPAGYNLNGMNKNEDRDLIERLNKLENSIKAKGTDWGGTVNPASDDILRTISYWNDTRNTDKDRGIIRMIIDNLPTAVEERTMQQDYAQKLAKALTDKAAEFKAEFEGSFPKLDAAVKAVNDASAAIKDNKTCTTDNLKKLADAFDKLYAMLRMMEAEKVRNTIQSKYSFLNNISTTDTDFVTDDLVVKSTKEDLAKEGITATVDIDAVPKEDIEVEEPGEKAEEDKNECPEDPEKALEFLVEKEHLRTTKKEGVYTTKTTSTTGEKARFYELKNGKLVELTNIKEIKDDGTIVKIDDTKAEDESKVAMDGDTINHSADIIDYSTAVKMIEENKTAGKLKQIADFPDGTKCYRSEGKDENGRYRCFVIRNNKLMKIKGAIHGGGSVTPDRTNTKTTFADLTDDDFSEVTAADLEKTDLKAKKEADDAAAAAAAAQTPTPTAGEGTTASGATETQTKKYKPLEQKDHEDAYKEAKDAGQETAKKLWGKTDSTDWSVAKEKIESIDEDNIHWFLSAYVNSDNSWSSLVTNRDNIIEQILDENDPKEERYELMQHIINKTLEHYIKYGGSEENKTYQRLKEACASFTVDDVESHSEFKITINDHEETHNYKDIDRWILSLLKINSTL